VTENGQGFLFVGRSLRLKHRQHRVFSHIGMGVSPRIPLPNQVSIASFYFYEEREACKNISIFYIGVICAAF
jgi:hypothetical protein